MMKTKLIFSLLLCCFFSTTVAEDILTFSKPEYKQRYEQLLEELRCLVCQNQNLADSNAGLATDLKEEVYSMVETGKDNTEIKHFLTLRYGDFILYKPPFNWRTVFLWIGPFILLLATFIFLFIHIKQRQSNIKQDANLNNNEKAELDALLKKHGDEQ